MTEVRLDVDYPHPVELVWRALTDRTVLGHWRMPGNLTPTVGGRFQLTPEDAAGAIGPVSVEVIEAHAPRRLVMQWTGELLHTTMSWELEHTPGGSRLSVRQNGFLGTPQSTRQRELRQAYVELFDGALHPVLDRLAAGEELPPAPARAAPTRPMTLAPPRRRYRLRGQRLAITAVLVLLLGGVAAAVVVVPGASHRPRTATGAAIDDSTGTPIEWSPDPVSAPTSAGRPAGSPTAHPVSASPSLAALPLAVPDASIGGHLTAQYETLNGSAIGDYTGRITLLASGGGSVSAWSVVITLTGRAQVQNVSGAKASQVGETVTFTPSGNDLVAPGHPVAFTFGVSKLIGVRYPLTCTVNGQPCAGIPG